MKATIEDLKLELWLRLREQGKILWETASGEEKPINEMSKEHIENAISYFERKAERDEIILDNLDVVM